MGKHKKKHSKKDDVAEDLFDAAALSVRKFRKVTDEIAKLSPGQKLVGGLALLAGGLLYLNKLKNDGADFPFNLHLPRLPAAPEPAAEEGSAEEVPAPPKSHKHHKSPRPGKPSGPAGRKSAGPLLDQ
ncbi:hypothetical protein [Hymenobacter persicinus]|uniref:Uncharacterized protein n=1 Tax=Hymenobacter persicinus TaxID=2025506 RepID=A0A4Q5L8U1_9BACT|nr:hypothetical protein [Hymenobacter persicinus]RYU78112.1 hypothetical protein EWM57_15410 [Hymenobacter persicinus]